MGFLCSYLMELVALALPSKRTERGGILMTCGAHRKYYPSTPGRRRPLPVQPSLRTPGWRRSKQGPNDVRGGEIPPMDPGRKRHLPHANREASLGSGCKVVARRHRGSRHGRRRSTAVDGAGCSVNRARRSCILIDQSHSGARTAPCTTALYTMFPLPDTRSPGSRQTADRAAHRGRCALPCNPPPV